MYNICIPNNYIQKPDISMFYLVSRQLTTPMEEKHTDFTQVLKSEPF